MILTEYFFECLVLLAHLFCIPYEVLYITSKNSRQYEVPPLSQQRMDTLKQFFKQDFMMYDFFNQSLHRKIDAFGHKVSKLSHIEPEICILSRMRSRSPTQRLLNLTECCSRLTCCNLYTLIKMV